MELNTKGLLDRKSWEAAGYRLPAFSRQAAGDAARTCPRWIHFGAGNIFRAYQANLMQQLLNEKKAEAGLIVAEGFDYEIVEKMYRPHDNCSILVTLKADGSVEKTVIGSVVESLLLDRDRETDFARLTDIFSAKSLQMASFTITEKGYSLTDAGGSPLPSVLSDFAAGPRKASSYLGKICSLLYARYESEKLPIAMVSMDNCSHNGDKLKSAMLAFAEAWVKNGTADAGFLDYVSDPSRVSYPWSMIDKITPRPDPKVEAILAADGIADPMPVVTAKNTWVAPFVNAEECQYLVIEDAFPNGRPPLEDTGVIFTDKSTVDRVEKMKVCTCLNPLHTALAIFGCLLGYTLISEEMKNPALKKLVERIGYVEGMPVAADPGILDPGQFLSEVLTLRLPNPFMPDSPQRIATDTSQKLPIRFGETIKAYIASPKLSPTDLTAIPLVFAGWLRYLMGMDDSGNVFQPSADPMLEAVTPFVADLTFGRTCTLQQLSLLLSRADIFGVDLIEAGLADRVISYLNEMLTGPGAVAALLKRYTETD